MFNICSTLQLLTEVLAQTRLQICQTLTFPQVITQRKISQTLYMQAAPVSTSLQSAVSSILQWSTHFGVNDTGTPELFTILHKSFTIADGSDDSITGMPTSLDKAIAMVNTMKQPKVSELLVCPECLSVYGDWHEMQVSHCIHVAAPFHTQCSRRGTCGVALYRSGAVRRQY